MPALYGPRGALGSNRPYPAGPRASGAGRGREGRPGRGSGVPAASSGPAGGGRGLSRARQRGMCLGGEARYITLLFHIPKKCV